MLAVNSTALATASTCKYLPTPNATNAGADSPHLDSLAILDLGMQRWYFGATLCGYIISRLVALSTSHTQPFNKAALLPFGLACAVLHPWMMEHKHKRHC